MRLMSPGGLLSQVHTIVNHAHNTHTHTDKPRRRGNKEATASVVTEVKAREPQGRFPTFRHLIRIDPSKLYS